LEVILAAGVVQVVVEAPAVKVANRAAVVALVAAQEATLEMAEQMANNLHSRMSH